MLKGIGGAYYLVGKGFSGPTARQDVSRNVDCTAPGLLLKVIQMGPISSKGYMGLMWPSG